MPENDIISDSLSKKIDFSNNTKQTVKLFKSLENKMNQTLPSEMCLYERN